MDYRKLEAFLHSKGNNQQSEEPQQNEKKSANYVPNKGLIP